MSFRLSLLLLLFWLTIGSSCHSHRKALAVIIQPFAGFPPADAMTVLRDIKAVNPSTQLRPAIPLLATALNKGGSRYRADQLIQFLAGRVTGDTIVIGLTASDISTTKGSIQDWGIIGLGYCPGTACIVSTFRLARNNRQDQLYKVALHELGHTQGLPHCPDKTCYMRDAEGGNPTDAEKNFCPKCNAILRSKGWLLR